jgi:UDP-glucose:glycoprotein glucosyltransferase
LTRNLYSRISFWKVSTLFGITIHSDAHHKIDYVGHAADATTEEAPRGLQFDLETPSSGPVSDTITMANLGYFQLKANPGVWNMLIRPGRGREVYDFVGVEDVYQREGALIENIGARIVLNGFEGVTVFPSVKKKPGMESEDVLPSQEEEKEKSGGIWNNLKKT